MNREDKKIEIRFESKTNLELKQETGDNKYAAMSQAAVSEALAEAVRAAVAQAVNSSCIENISYGTLAIKRSRGELIPGRRYRIVDYVTTCAKDGAGTGSAIVCSSAGHGFDIIVMATSSDTLDENARAIQNRYDTYFSGSRLSEWELKYSLDNDSKRWKWAVNGGKGVIYYMKDEHGNVCHYDFKNINFVYEDSSRPSGVASGVPYYTYSLAASENASDYSLDGKCRDNVIEASRDDDGRYILPGNVFVNFGISDCCYRNRIGADSYNNRFGYSCSENVLGLRCRDNQVSKFSCNVIGDDFSENVVEVDLVGNRLGNYFFSNRIAGEMTRCVIGDNFAYNTVFGYLNESRVGNDCNGNYFKGSDYVEYGDYCSNNVFLTSRVKDLDFENITEDMLASCTNVRLEGYNTDNVFVCGTGNAYGIAVGRLVFGLDNVSIPDKAEGFELKIVTDSRGNVQMYCEGDIVNSLRS